MSPARWVAGFMSVWHILLASGIAWAAGDAVPVEPEWYEGPARWYGAAFCAVVSGVLYLLSQQVRREASQRMTASQARASVLRMDIPEVSPNSARVSELEAALSGDAVAPRGPARRVGLSRLSGWDLGFSEPAFVAYAAALFAAAHWGRGARTLDALGGLLSEGAKESLRTGRADLDGIDEVLVGPCRVIGASADELWCRVEVQIEALITERRRGAARTFLFRERWSFSHRSGLATPAPDRLLARVADPALPAEDGEAVWVAQSVLDRYREPLGPPPARPGPDNEPGTELSTVLDPGLDDDLVALRARDPGFDEGDFAEAARRVFALAHAARVTGEVEPLRAVATDGLVGAVSYGWERLGRAGREQHVEDTVVGRVELCRVAADRHAELLTARIYAAQREWLTTEAGEVAARTPEQVRDFSEYWSFTRPIDGGPWKAWLVEADEDYDG